MQSHDGKGIYPSTRMVITTSGHSRTCLSSVPLSQAFPLENLDVLENFSQVVEKAGLCLGEQRQPGACGEEPEGGHL